VVAGLALSAVGAVASLSAVVGRERGEVDAWSAPRSLGEAPDAAGRLVLDAVDVRAGDAAVFEVCFDERLEAARWEPARLSLGVFAVEGEETAAVVQTTLDGVLLASQATRRNETSTCIVVADAAELAASGRLETAVVWSAPGSTSPEARGALRDVAVRSHVVTRTPLRPGDLWSMALLAAGLLLALGAAAAPGRRSSAARAAPATPERASVPEPGAPAPATTARIAAWRPVAGLLASWVFGAAIALALAGGPALVLVASWAHRLVDLALAFALTPARAGGGPAARLRALGLRPALRWPVLALALAPLAGAVVAVVGGVVSSVVRSLVPLATRVSAVETFVAWPSGTLAVTANAVLAPVAEEVFYRGFLYGALEGRAGRAGAVALSSLAFVVPHLPQSWGAWGNVAAIALSGLCFGLLRAATGSTAIAAIAHLAHNALLAVIDAAAAR
jgi:membrane protease YdiL (CAAX protease family)